MDLTCIPNRTEQLLNIQSYTLHIFCDKYTAYVTDRILVIGNTSIIVNGLISYCDTLNFVPTMEVSGNGNEKCEISTIHDSSDSTH